MLYRCIKFINRISKKSDSNIYKLTHDPDFSYKNITLKIKNDVRYSIEFNYDDKKLFTLSNVKIYSPNPLLKIYKHNDLWDVELYIDTLDIHNILSLFCKKFDIKTIYKNN